MFVDLEDIQMSSVDLDEFIQKVTNYQNSEYAQEGSYQRILKRRDIWERLSDRYVSTMSAARWSEWRVVVIKALTGASRPISAASWRYRAAVRRTTPNVSPRPTPRCRS